MFLQTRQVAVVAGGGDVVRQVAVVGDDDVVGVVFANHATHEPN